MDLPPLPEWTVICDVMLLLHKTEAEIYAGMSPAMINRVLWIHNQREKAQAAKH